MEEEVQAGQTCETCRHFYRHYVRVAANRYTPLHLGHCADPRCRDKKVTTPACHRYAARPKPKGA